MSGGINLDDLELEDDNGIDDNSMPTLELEEAAPAVVAVQPESPALPVMQVLPADFRLPALIKFCPNPAVKAAIDQASAYALSLEVVGVEGLQAADLALAAVNDSLKVADAEFEDAASLANELHKGITGTRATWKSTGENAKRLLGTRMYTERQRLEGIAREERRKAQAAADEQARRDAEARAKEAEKNQAPPAVVQQLKQEAKTAVAPPVPVAPPPAAAMRSSTTVTTWKARIKGTPADADANPDIEELTPAQWLEVSQLLSDIANGKAPRGCVMLNWPYLNGRAKSDKSTLVITGIEAFSEGGVRAKGSRSRG